MPKNSSTADRSTPIPTSNLAHRAALGKALGRRAAAAADHVTAHVPTLKEMVDCRLATEILGRWLETGRGATDAELDTIVRPGVVRRWFSIEAFCTGFSIWRETIHGILREEASHHGVPDNELNAITAMISRGLDTSLIRSGRVFDRAHERVEQEIEVERSQLAHEALHDALTGLPNRMLLSERIKRAVAAALRYGERVAVLFIDLDGFKAVNDRLGHAAGDAVLCQASERILDAVRPHDTVARLGGDELLVLCERLASPDEATAIVDRILRRLAAPYEIEGESVNVGASIGLAMGDDPQDAAALISAADAAMYLAKRRGGSQSADARELATRS